MTDKEKEDLNMWIWTNIFKMREHKFDKTSDGIAIYERMYIPENISPDLPYNELKKHWKLLNVPEFCTDPSSAMLVLKKCLTKMQMEIVHIARTGEEVEPGAKAPIQIAGHNGLWWIWSGGIKQTSTTLELAICLFAKKLYLNEV
jgi:hypothetical protein